MKHLFFVSVAMGIFSGTSVSVKAQAAANSVASTDAKAVNKSPKFIEGIEIRTEPIDVGWQLYVKPQGKNSGTVPVSPRNETSIIEQCTALQFKYAQILNMDVETVTNFDLYNFIEKWWATPYRYGGAANNGIDCSAYSGTLVHEVYRTDLSRTASAQYKESEKVAKENLREGDLVFFKTRRGVSHVGVYLQNGYFTHASVANGVTISNLDEPYYHKKYIGSRRVVPFNRTKE